LNCVYVIHHLFKKMQSSIQKLQSLLGSRPDLSSALEASIKKAEQPGVETITDFYDFIQEILTFIPTESEINTDEEKFFYLISQSPDNLLKKDLDFNDWIKEYAREVGEFMDTPASADGLDTFITNPSYQIENYYQMPGGWQTFNQFISRPIKSGKRPIAEPCNDKVIVSTTDSVYLGQWPVRNASVMTKGTQYSVIALLDDSPYQDKFKDGVFTHSYLSLNDYHHFHVPAAGTIREVRNIPGNTMLNVIRNAEGKLEDVDGVDYQFTQTRGLVVLEASVGFVAILAVGMGHVSSVTLTVDEGDTLAKGDDFGYFSFGGSDMVMLFESERVKFTAEGNQHYKQGEQIAIAI
jgi:phosphatidylserine decarboxylase